MGNIEMESGTGVQLSEQGNHFRFEADICASLGTACHDAYVSNDPFPHIVIDNFIDRQILDHILEEFPQRETGRFSDNYSRLKTGYTLNQIKSAYISSFLDALNSAAFLVFLQNMTGIKGLVGDPWFMGGGLHETARGGHLSIHADFNVHPRTHMMRRLNLILFLNDNWPDSYGGHLELWDRQMKACRKKVAPVMGRAVIFNTDTTSYHGHPEPLSCPDGVFRRSIALYYYTAPSTSRVGRHTTLFQPRAGTNDAPLPLSVRMANSFRRIVHPFTSH